jgi:acyl-CoA synthetase (AMP-forming)/AMP-acid ligase II
MVAHTLESLTAAIKGDQHQGTDVVWGTFYDIRRYGGLQIFLRFLLGRGSMVLSASDESAMEHLARLALRSVTHLTGTPSHWRRALMTPSVRDIAPRYIRLSGEIVDQAVLSSLRATFPDAAIGHAFASTEAGVCFEVKDGMDGFPASFVGANDRVEIKIENRSLKVRSPRTATRYIGQEDSALRDAEGFVDTGDVVELRGNRFYFLGRQTGIINVGGLKVHPEEIESLLNSHPAVRMSLVRPLRNPITGSLVVADIVLKPDTNTDAAQIAQLKLEILRMCREMLPRHKIPATLNVVPTIDIAASGKLVRSA